MRAALLQLMVSDRETADQRSQRVQSLLSRFSEQKEHYDILLLPELWKVGYSNYEHYHRGAEPLHGGTVRTFSRWAQRLSCTMIPGSFLERQKEGGLYNAMPLIEADGTPRAIYRKIHLFGYESEERKLLEPGREIVTAQTGAGRIGMATCYDLRFPEQFRAMADAGAEIFCVAAAWPRERRSDWRTFCRARALENQCYLLACNHVGRLNGVVGAGHSMIVAPDGTILAEAGEEEELVTAEMDLRTVARVRKTFPALHDRVAMDSLTVVTQ